MANAFSGELTIANMEWDESLRDPSSELFHTLAGRIEEDLRTLFVSVSPAPGAALTVLVGQFLPGSVIVHYSLGWQTLANDTQLLTAATVQRRITEQLKNENGMLFGKFAISRESVRVRYTLWECGHLNCSYACSFSYTSLTFLCDCPQVTALLLCPVQASSSGHAEDRRWLC